MEKNSDVGSCSRASLRPRRGHVPSLARTHTAHGLGVGVVGVEVRPATALRSSPVKCATMQQCASAPLPGEGPGCRAGWRCWQRSGASRGCCG
eukprot:18147-Prorocentrum_lima.AAC.1